MTEVSLLDARNDMTLDKSAWQLDSRDLSLVWDRRCLGRLRVTILLIFSDADLFRAVISNTSNCLQAVKARRDTLKYA